MRKYVTPIIATMVLSMIPVPVLADNPMCDATMWEQMVERARLQGQMENSVAENLIYQGDSVLEYTCFGELAGDSVDNASYYSTGAYTKGELVPATQNYIQQNFKGGLLGGRMDQVAAGSPCDMMNKVWQAAKCMNFDDMEPQDDFFSMDEFMDGDDIRQLPEACSKPSADKYGDLPAIADDIDPHLLKSPTDCGIAISTGLKIDQPSGDTADTSKTDNMPDQYSEKICENPACTYIPDGGGGGKCQL